MMEVLIFNIDNKSKYGIEVEYVIEIIQTPEIVEIPQTPNYIVGVVNVRGLAIPMVNLSGVLGFVGKNEFKNTIIVEYNNKKFGLLVENIEDIINLNSADLRDVPPVLKSSIKKNIIKNLAISSQTSQVSSQQSDILTTTRQNIHSIIDLDLFFKVCNVDV